MPIASDLESLPDEILQTIFALLSPETLLSLQQTSKRLRAIADEPLLWRIHCQTNYKFWKDHLSFALDLARPARDVKWQERFRVRKRQDVHIKATFDHILASQRGRVEAFGSIAALGFDAKDFMLAQISEDVEESDNLARTWWSKAVLDHIHRRSALEEWTRVANTERDEDLSLERALVAFDVFALGTRTGGFSGVSVALDRLVESFKQEQPELDDLSTRTKVLRLLEYVRRSGFTGIENEHLNYHSMPNNFFGQAVLSPRHQTLPLVLICVISCLGKRLGLDIRATNVPMHCFGTVFAPPGLTLNGAPSASHTLDQMFIDPFRHAEEVTPEVITTYLTNMGYPNPDSPEHVSAATVRNVILRMTRNIITSHQTVARQPALAQQGEDELVDPHDALYAALWAMFTINAVLDDDEPVAAAATSADRRSRIVPWLHEDVSSRLPWDVTLLEDYVLPTLVPWYGSPEAIQLARENPAMSNLPHVSEVERSRKRLERDIRAIHQDDILERTPKDRSQINAEASSSWGPLRAVQRMYSAVPESSGEEKVKYKVGSVIRHRRYGYEGMIVGWDPKCLKGDMWITQMGVDSLPGGRGQSFYDVVASDTSRRYVAEENVEITTARPTSLLMSQAGQWFKRWDATLGKYESNVKDEYPDD